MRTFILKNLRSAIALASVATFVFCVIFALQKRLPDHGTRAKFSSVWRSTHAMERHRLLPALLSAKPERGQVYEARETMLKGMNLAETQRFLGGGNIRVTADKTVLTYKVGSIETDLVGRLIPGFGKLDYVTIHFDASDENIAEIKTTH